jgi:hypothetical protein
LISIYWYTVIHGHYTDILWYTVTILIYCDTRSLYWYTVIHGHYIDILWFTVTILIYCDTRSLYFLHLIVKQTTVCKQYGTPQCTHLLNAPCLYIQYWYEDGSIEPKHVALCVNKLYIFVVFEWIYQLSENYYYYYFTAIGMKPGGSSTAHIYTQTVHTTHRMKHTSHNNKK